MQIFVPKAPNILVMNEIRGNIIHIFVSNQKRFAKKIIRKKLVNNKK